MYDNQDSPKRIHPQSHESTLPLCVWILDRDRKRISKCLFSVSEADLVLCEIRSGFHGIEFDVHSRYYAYNYAYRQASGRVDLSETANAKGNRRRPDAERSPRASRRPS